MTRTFTLRVTAIEEHQSLFSVFGEPQVLVTAGASEQAGLPGGLRYIVPVGQEPSLGSTVTFDIVDDAREVT